MYEVGSHKNQNRGGSQMRNNGGNDRGRSNSRKKNMILYHIHVLIKNNFVIITVIMKVTCNDKFNTVYYFWTLFYFMV